MLPLLFHIKQTSKEGKLRRAERAYFAAVSSKKQKPCETQRTAAFLLLLLLDYAFLAMHFLHNTKYSTDVCFFFFFFHLVSG